jgi:hypothetical protein
MITSIQIIAPLLMNCNPSHKFVAHPRAVEAEGAACAFFPLEILAAKMRAQRLEMESLFNAEKALDG